MVRNDTLFYVSGKNRLQVVVGDEKKEEIIKDILGGTEQQAVVISDRIGLSRSRKSQNASAWWKGASDDVREYCRKCEKCQISNPLNKADVAELHPLPVSSELPGY